MDIEGREREQRRKQPEHGEQPHDLLAGILLAEKFIVFPAEEHERLGRDRHARLGQETPTLIGDELCGCAVAGLLLGPGGGLPVDLEGAGEPRLDPGDDPVEEGPFTEFLGEPRPQAGLGLNQERLGHLHAERLGRITDRMNIDLVLAALVEGVLDLFEHPGGLEILKRQIDSLLEEQ